MRVAIVGAERLGRALASDLLSAGHDVRVLDDSGDRLARLHAALGDRASRGSPLDREALAAAAEGCDSLAAVTADDNVNAIVALAARRELRVPLTIAVVGNVARARALTGLGAHIVCPTVHTARELHLTLVRSGVESELRLGPDAEVYRAELPLRLSGRRLAELERPGELVPVAVERGTHMLLARPDLEVRNGDVLHAAAVDRILLTELTRP